MLAVGPRGANASTVRQALREDLDAVGASDECVDDAVLVASELVGNAVVHGRSADGAYRDDLDISWEVRDGEVRLCVSDCNEALPRPRDAAAHEANGRGLAIVAALAVDWGVEPCPGGKQVWARMTLGRTA